MYRDLAHPPALMYYACTEQGISIYYEAYLYAQWKYTLARCFVEGKVHNATVFVKRCKDLFLITQRQIS
jgi:hypothetical protein